MLFKNLCVSAAMAFLSAIISSHFLSTSATKALQSSYIYATWLYKNDIISLLECVSLCALLESLKLFARELKWSISPRPAFSRPAESLYDYSRFVRLLVTLPGVYCTLLCLLPKWALILSFNSFLMASFLIWEAILWSINIGGFTSGFGFFITFNFGFFSFCFSFYLFDDPPDEADLDL